MSGELAQWIETLTKPKAVLVVDDEEFVLSVFRAIEQAFNMRMDFAANGDEACDRVRTKVYDYVFLDMHLERTSSGMEVLHAINAAQSEATVTIMSGSVSLHDIMHDANRLGVISFIRKPVAFTTSYLFQIFKKLGLQPTGLQPAKPDLLYWPPTNGSNRPAPE